MRRIGIALAVLLCVCLALPGRARADDFDLPGVSGDAASYVKLLHARAPAGSTPKARAAADQAVQQARAKGDFAASADALEQRLALGTGSAALWLALADAQLHRTPPDLKHAVLAAWLSFRRADGQIEPETAALPLLADALRAENLDAQAVLVLEQLLQRLPDDAGVQRKLADAQRAAGLTVRRVTVEGEADPPRGCIAFSVPPSRSSDLEPQDWVRLDPPVSGAAVSREGDQFCVSGLPSGVATHAVIRAGLPAEAHDRAAALTLLHDAAVTFDMPNRLPRIIFDTGKFVLARSQAASVGLSTVNLSAVSLRLLRLTERNVAEFLRNRKLGEAVESYAAQYAGEQNGSVVWTGHADIPKWTANKTAHTSLPLPPALLTAGPGLYALIATPGDGTPDHGETASVQMILRTDLAPTIWRGADGLTVQVRSYADAAVRENIRLRLLARNNDQLAETQTDADGVGRFAAPLLHGEGPLTPAVVEAFGPDDDYAALDLNAAAFDLSDRGVAGAADPGPLDAFVWTDRGIYRPGETVQVQALLRDNAGAPADFPAQITLRRPNGQIFLQGTPPRAGGASVVWPAKLSAGAAAGTWVVEIRADPAAPPIGRAEFRVDAFVPDRMAVDLGKLPPALLPGQDTALPVAARFLYGAPGSGLSGHGYATVTVDPAPFPALDGFRFGLEDDIFAPEPQDAALPPTDAQGMTSYAPHFAQAPDSTHPLKADIVVAIDDPSGHAAKAAASLPLRGTAPLIGIRPAFSGGEIDAKAEAAFDIVAVAPDGARRPLAAKLRLVRERPDWRLVVNGRLARYETVYRDEPLETEAVTIPADAPLRFARTLDFGRYRLDVSETGGLAATSVRFRAGWGDTDSPDVPDRVDVSAAVRTVAPGGLARIHIAPPFAGQATLLVLTDRVRALRTLAVPATGADVDVPADAAWGPGAYVAVHLFRGASRDGGPPTRAIGLVWVGVDPAPRTLPVAIEAADTLPPRGRATIAVRTAPGAWVTLAAVDEGILRLTRFASPDPTAHFLGRRRLGLDIRDDWGRLIAPPEGDAATLRQGGDEGGFALPDIPVRTVTLFAGPVQAGADGRAAIPLDLPDFAGQIRLMAVAWEGSRLGAANRDVIVRDRMVAEPLLPRFLAPGDTTRLAVLLDNLELPPGTATVSLQVGGPLALPDGDTLRADLAQGARTVLTTKLQATGAGRGTLRMDVTGPAGFQVSHEVALTVRPSRGPTTRTAGAEIPAGGSLMLASPLPEEGFVAGTFSLSARFGGPVRYDAAALETALRDYPLSCLEQTASQALALATGQASPPGALAAAIASILDRQRFDGGFALWSASGEAQPWLSPYAVDVLLHARDAGVAVPQAALDEALQFLASETDGAGDAPADVAAQAYRLYVLAKAGQGRPGAARVLAQAPDSLPTPLARAQLGAALALAHDTPRATDAFAAALRAPDRGWWAEDYGSALRDQAAIAVLLRDSGLFPERLARLVAALPGADLMPNTLNTQEQAWLVAAARTLGAGRASVHVALGDQEVSGAAATVPMTGGSALARNLATQPVWASVSATGVLRDPPPAQRSRMRVSRRFFSLDGATLNLADMHQNDGFVLLIEGSAEDGQAHRAMLLQGLPAGWEIAGRLAGKQDAMPWLGELTAPEAEPAADDRYAAVLALTPEKPGFRLAVRLRATTPGDYEIPGAELSDMYRPAVFARQTTNRITVLPRE